MYQSVQTAVLYMIIILRGHWRWGRFIALVDILPDSMKSPTKSQYPWKLHEKEYWGGERLLQRARNWQRYDMERKTVF